MAHGLALDTSRAMRRVAMATVLAEIYESDVLYVSRMNVLLLLRWWAYALKRWSCAGQLV